MNQIKHQVVDTRTQSVVGTFKNKQAARNKRDRLDLEHGAIRYRVQSVAEDEDAGRCPAQSHRDRAADPNTAGDQLRRRCIVKNCIVTFRSYRRDGNHEDAIAGSLFGPAGCVMTRDDAERRVRTIESRPDRFARVREFETEAMAFEHARSLCLPWFVRSQTI